MSLKVDEPTIVECLQYTRDGHWKVPGFQRDFVWTQQQVTEAAESIVKSRPIGMLTLWTQPEGNPVLPEAKPLSLKGRHFGVMDTTVEPQPAVQHFILDGRQRLTTLAILFGGLRAPDDRYSFSGYWYLNLNRKDEQDPIVIYKKSREHKQQGLDQLSNQLTQGLLPLWNPKEFQTFANKIERHDLYPKEQLPDNLEDRTEILNDFISSFTRYKVPTAFLPSSMTLSDVCEIFDVLNQTGTRVSVFDLVHNTLFSKSEGTFELRGKTDSYAQDYPEGLGLFISESRREFFCQLATACHISTTAKREDNTRSISSLKGSDLLATPYSHYIELENRVELLNEACERLNEKVLEGHYRLSELPYPVSVLLYLALDWQLALSKQGKFTRDQLARICKAFFWRNALSTRYDQGFLTKFTADLDFIEKTLVDASNYNDPEVWADYCDNAIKLHFGDDNKPRPFEELRTQCVVGDTRGALKQAFEMRLWNPSVRDVKSGKTLARTGIQGEEAGDLHHIFPRSWCNDNIAQWSERAVQFLGNPALSEALQMRDDVVKPFIDSIANKMPMSSDTNKQWRSREPRTAIQYLRLQWNSQSESTWSHVFIDRKAYDILKSEAPDPITFWNYRAELLARSIERLQYVKTTNATVPPG